MHVLLRRKNPLRIALVVKNFYRKFRHLLSTDSVFDAALMPGGRPFHTSYTGAVAFQGAGLDAAPLQLSDRTRTSARDLSA
jgi:hypothetical protein